MTQERFIDLVRQEQEPLRRFLLALCSGDAALADDIAQDALVRAYVASGSFLGLSRFSTWLFRIAYNCYIDHCRHLASRPEASIDEAMSVVSGDSADDSFRHQQLYQAMDTLSEKEKAAIVLFYFEDKSIKDISTILHMPAGTVKYHLSVGRNHLKQKLQPCMK
ncbi:MAG: RNA polymerase sigma factor [Bacteroidales bacterium]|nr:RNA polymerase sigma factor [Bacteroidales bacterium]